MGIYAFRDGPTYAPSTAEDEWNAALAMPLSLTSTLGESFKGGILDSLGLGTAIRETALPEEAPTQQLFTTRGPTGELITLPDTPQMRRRATVQGFELQRETQQQLDVRRRDVGALAEDQYKSSPYYREGVKWDAGMTEDRAAALAEAYDAKRVREYFATKRPITSFIGNLAGQAVDPINYIPIAGPAVKAANVARFGRVVGGAATGALDAAANTALASAATFDVRKSMGDDITWQSTISDIAMSALIGGAFGSIGGVIDARRAGKLAVAEAAARDRLSTLRNVQDARVALNSAIDGIARGEDVNLGGNAVDSLARISKDAPRYLTSLPAGESLFIPPTPTKAQMDSFSVTEPVPLNATRSTQNTMQWDRFDAGDYGVPLIEGYSDIPVAVKKENGEYLIFDGHHRAVKALNEGKESMPMRVINAKDYAPEFAGRKPSKSEISDEDLLSELFADEPSVVEGRSVGTPEAGQLAPTPRNVVRAASIDNTTAKPEPIPTGKMEAETRVAKPETYKMISEQYRVNPDDGSFVEQADIEQIRKEGRITPEDDMELNEAQATFDNGLAFGEALKAAAACVI